MEVVDFQEKIPILDPLMAACKVLIAEGLAFAFLQILAVALWSLDARTADYLEEHQWMAKAVMLGGMTG